VFPLNAFNLFVQPMFSDIDELYLVCIIRIQDPKNLIYRDNFRDNYQPSDNPILTVLLRDGMYNDPISDDRKFKSETFSIRYNPLMKLKKLKNLIIPEYKTKTCKNNNSRWYIQQVVHDGYIYIVCLNDLKKLLSLILTMSNLQIVQGKGITADEYEGSPLQDSKDFAYYNITEGSEIVFERIVVPKFLQSAKLFEKQTAIAEYLKYRFGDINKVKTIHNYYSADDRNKNERTEFPCIIEQVLTTDCLTVENTEIEKKKLTVHQLLAAAFQRKGLRYFEEDDVITSLNFLAFHKNL